MKSPKKIYWWNKMKCEKKTKKIYTKINFSEIDIFFGTTFFCFFLTKKKIFYILSLDKFF